MESNVTVSFSNRGSQFDAKIKKHTTSPQLNAQKDRTRTVVKSRPATRNLSNSMSSAFTHLGENIVQQTALSQRLAIKSWFSHIVFWSGGHHLHHHPKINTLVLT